MTKLKWWHNVVNIIGAEIVIMTECVFATKNVICNLLLKMW